MFSIYYVFIQKATLSEENICIVSETGQNKSNQGVQHPTYVARTRSYGIINYEMACRYHIYAF